MSEQTHLFMKARLIYLGIVISMLISSCKKTEEPIDLVTEIAEKSIVDKLKSAGFNTSQGFRPYKDGYLVEYDIFLTEKQIDELISVTKKPSKIPGTKHYRANGLVTGPTAILVYLDPSFDAFMQSSLDIALVRYNNLNLNLKFVWSREAGNVFYNKTISIGAFYDSSGPLGYSGNFPSQGYPGNSIMLNTFYYNGSNRTDAATTIAHEIGHAIGFRHTDYMDRTFSCGNEGINPNEGSGGVGAIHIPGTPTTPVTGSWMLACSSNVDRPFTPDDITALLATYPFQYPDGTVVDNVPSFFPPYQGMFVHFGGAAFAVPSTQVLNDLYGGSGNVQQYYENYGYYETSSIPRNGTILRETSYPEVYLIENGLKRWIRSGTSLDILGGWSNVRTIHDGALSSIPAGVDIP